MKAFSFVGLCFILAATPSFGAEKPTPQPIKKEVKKENPPIPVPSVPAPAPIPKPPTSLPPQTGPAPKPPIYSNPPPIPYRAPHYTTKVPQPVNPRVMKTKAGNPAQTYLGNMTDMRDLEITMDNIQGQEHAALAAAESYAKLLARQKLLFERGALSADELAQSTFDAESSAAYAKLYAAQIEFYRGRRDQKEYQARVAAHQTSFDLAKLYAMYEREWQGQCRGEKASVEVSEAQLHLNQHLYDSTHRAYQSGAASIFEVEQRHRDLTAASADVQAKKDSEARCMVGLPTLAELGAMMDAEH